MMTEQEDVPVRTYRVSHGEWNCVRCHDPLGATIHPLTGAFLADIPARCPHRARCMAEMAAMVYQPPEGEA